jgi:hypothetical protein
MKGSRGRLDRGRVARLVEHDVDTPRQDEGGGDSPPLVQGLTSNVHPLVTKLLYGLGDVVAHERQLMTDAALDGGALRWMNSKLCWRQGEDQPSVACINISEAEHISKGVAQR